MAGYGAAGEAKVFDGLLRLTGGPGMPGFAPAANPTIRQSPQPVLR
ncbi:hypothetical protein ACWF82_23490 [Nocardia sp. NPDC055053]